MEISMKSLALKLCVTFCVGAIIAGTAVLLLKEPGNGLGGLETPGMPQYSAESVVSSVEEVSTNDFDQVATLEKAESIVEEDVPLTYQTYRIKSGDMIGVLAENYGVTQDTLISVNNIRQSRLIRPGQYIKIPSMPGILYNVKSTGETPQSIAEKYQVDAYKCAMANNMKLDNELKSGSSIFVPDAELDWMTKQEINGDLFIRPIHARYRISSYFGWRPSPFTGRRSWHGGLDMACPAWTKIYAACPGRVIKVAYSNVYGNYVIIQHHSGYQTLYGHMIKQNCKVGQTVGTNSIIGYVGSTGQSTGPHCHFTIFKNGKMINPVNLSFNYRG